MGELPCLALPWPLGTMFLGQGGAAAGRAEHLRAKSTGKQPQNMKRKRYYPSARQPVSLLQGISANVMRVVRARRRAYTRAAILLLSVG